MKRPTIYQIKKECQKNESHFFDRKTMKFAGQTLKDFKVLKSKTGRIFITAPLMYGGNTFMEFVNGKLICSDARESCISYEDYTRWVANLK